MNNSDHEQQSANAHRLLDQAAEPEIDADAAIELCRQAALLAPNDASVFRRFNVIAIEHGMLEEAVAAGRCSVALDPVNYHGWKSLGDALFNSRKFEPALAAYEQARAGSVDIAVQAMCCIVDVHLELGNLEQAVATAGRVHALSSSNEDVRADVLDWTSRSASILLERAHLCLEHDEAERAVQLGRYAVELAPDDFDTWVDLSVMAREAEDFEVSRDAAVKASLIEPSHTDAWLALANAHRSLELLPEAVDFYRHALLLEPKNQLAVNNFGLTLNDLGEFQEAREVLEQGLADTPDNFAILYNLGDSLYELGDYEASVNRYRQALNLDPNTPALWTALSESLEACGRYQEAREAEEMAVKVERLLDEPPLGL